MALLDDLLRLFGTSRLRLRWKWDNWKKGARKTVDDAASAIKPGKQVGYVPKGRSRWHRLVGWAIPEEFPIVTVANIVIIVGLYFIMVKATHDAAAAAGAEGSPGFKPGSLQLIRYGVQWGPLVLDLREWWRMVTAIFLHLSLIHLIMNAVSLWVAGQAVEDLFGRPRTLLIWLVTGVAGFAVSMWWRADSFTAGASGSVFGLIGAVVGHVARHRGRSTQFLKERFVPWLLYGIIWSFIPGVNAAAHFGGLAAGLVLGFFLADTRQARKAPSWLWAVVTVLCLAVIVGSFWMAYRSPAAELVAAELEAAGRGR